MSQTALNAIEKRAAFSLASVFAFRMLGLFMLMPVLAVYGSELAGFSPLWIGLAIGAYGLTQAIFQIPMGWASDKFGRKPVIVLGLSVFALGSVIAALAESMQMVTLGRALHGMGAVASALMALAADLSRDEQRAKVMAVIGACIGMSFMLAMLVGPLVAASFGLSGLFWLIMWLAVIGIGIVLFAVPNVVHHAPRSETTANKASVLALVKSPQLLRLDFGVLMLHLTMTAVFVALPLELIKVGLEAQSHWQLYVPVFLLSFVLLVPMMMVAMKRNQEKGMFLFSVALLSASLLMMALLPLSVWSIAVAMVLYFAAFNYLEATMPALVSRIAPANQKGSAMGVYSSSQFFGAFAGGVIGGGLAELFTLQGVFAASSLIGVIWFAIAWSMRVPKRSKIISIATELSGQQQASQLASQLTALKGVLEATVVYEEQRTYLKVNDKEFDIKQARALSSGQI